MIVSRQNQRVKDIRRLRRSKGDRALLEGPHLVAEALAGGFELDFALATPSFLEDDGFRALVDALGERVEAIDEDVLRSVSDADSPRGVLAVAPLATGGVERLPVKPGGLYVYADGVQEPGNVGAMSRVMEAAGAAGLALGRGSAHPNHPRALRASAGSLLRLPTAREATVEELVRHLDEIEPQLVALVPHGGEELYATLLPDATTVLLVGAEGRGLDQALVERAQYAVSLPMAEPVESLNATVATAIALYELGRRRR